MSDDQGNPWSRPNLRTPPPNTEPYKPRKRETEEDDPAPFTPSWHAKRSEFLASVARRQKGLNWTEEQKTTAGLALELASLAHGMIGHEEAKAAFERNAAVKIARLTGNSVEGVIAAWKAGADKPRKIALPDLSVPF